jgi:hypothetical protein
MGNARHRPSDANMRLPPAWLPEARVDIFCRRRIH